MSAIVLWPGYKLVQRCDPKNLMAGMPTSRRTRRREINSGEIRGPICIPHQDFSVVLARNELPFSPSGLYVGVWDRAGTFFVLKKVYKAPCPDRRRSGLATDPAPLVSHAMSTSDSCAFGIKELPCS